MSLQLGNRMNHFSLSSFAAHGDRRRWLALAIVCLAQLMILLDTTIVNVGSPFDPARPALQPRESHLGHQRVPDHVRQLVAARRPPRRSVRPQAHVPRRRGRLHRRLDPLWAGAHPRCADRRPVHPGRRRRHAGVVILAIIATEFPQPSDRSRAMSAYVFVAVAGGSLGLLPVVRSPRRSAGTGSFSSTSRSARSPSSSAAH